jgi:hypothetical protein
MGTGEGIGTQVELDILFLISIMTENEEATHALALLRRINHLPSSFLLHRCVLEKGNSLWHQNSWCGHPISIGMNLIL